MVGQTSLSTLPVMKLDTKLAAGNPASIQCPTPRRQTPSSDGLGETPTSAATPRTTVVEIGPWDNGLPLTPDSLRQGQAGRRHPGRCSHAQRRGSCTSDIVFSPRPYENVYTEQAYVHKSLEHQSAKAVGLTHDICRLETELAVPDIDRKERRRLRKKVSLLKIQLNDAVGQKKILMTRLIELHIENQSHQTWTAARQESSARAQPCSPAASTPSQSYFGLPRPRGASTTPVSPLNAETPDFVPRRSSMPMCLPRKGVEPWLRSQTIDMVMSTTIDLEAVEEAIEDSPVDFACNHGLEYKWSGCEDSDDEDCEKEFTRRESEDATEKKPKGRRLSLPTLEVLWP